MIQGNKSIRPIKMLRILGTKVRVISWTCVAACRRLIRTPTTRPIPKMGKDTNKVILIAF
jgi:hypothetical protein